ncbi:hypothetical protein FBY35_0772 [Streptomyces sp. SLBN-118]|uniref:DUF6397 family protein n=1 Tax=Streptomyces sp. SLBN-118 TaxID=2768454 RepID=UPI00115005BC|nr:DUF6397 family protein [Streptomyces sp. SLBN-118]TQK50441.1 hypothetical protein FBY35_0772 [Streptomyces sp. SLBN-118]
MTVKEAATPGGAVRSLAPGRAAQELGLKRGELDLAVQLGHVRTMPDASGDPPRFDRQEIDRLRGAEGFPDALRERVRTVGTMEAAGLLSISPARFTRLARTGHFTPVRFYLNRYRAVVWLYLAEELREFALAHPALLSGRTPPELRVLLDAGEDRRARNWRGRRLGLLLRVTEDPWQQAATIGSVLDSATVAEVVTDPYERSYLRVLRPELVPGRTGTPAAREVVERLLRADHPDEILWHRVSLAHALREARELRPAPRPDARSEARPLGREVPVRSRPEPGLGPVAVAHRGGRSPHGRGLLARLRLRKERRDAARVGGEGRG